MKRRRRKKKEADEDDVDGDDVEQVSAETEVAEDENAVDTDFKFIAAETFDGAKPGYVFRKGDAGIGYYQDITSAGVCGEWESYFGNKTKQPVNAFGNTTADAPDTVEELGWSGVDDVL